eukprot:SM000361S13811  [mRNA]  locus=s361:58093:63443:- [translate_table: standard]
MQLARLAHLLLLGVCWPTCGAQVAKGQADASTLPSTNTFFTTSREASTERLTNKPAQTVGRAITDSADKLNGTTSWAAAQVGESAEAAKLTMAQVNVAANVISSAATHAGEAAYSAQVACAQAGDASNAIGKLANTTASLVGELGPRLSTTLDQASSTLAAVQDSANRITPQAASNLKTVQKSVQTLTPTAQSALHSLSATSEAVGQDIPALMQSYLDIGLACLLFRVDLSTACCSTGKLDLTHRLAHTRHKLLFEATESHQSHNLCILDVLHDFIKDMQERHLIRSRQCAKVVLLKGMEIFYHRNSMSFSCDKDTIEMPEGMGRFFMCSSTHLHRQPYLQLKGVSVTSGAPMGETMNLGWQPQHVALELEAYLERHWAGGCRMWAKGERAVAAACSWMDPSIKGETGRRSMWTGNSQLSEVVAHLLLASRAPLEPQQLGESREVADGEAESGGGIHEPARSVSVEVRVAGETSLGQPRHGGDGARAWGAR